MKILNGGKKDYYDYLVGTYGIDEHVVYDRRDSIKIREFESGELYFIKRKLYEDSERKETIVYETENNKTKRLIKLIGKLYYFVLEVGNRKFLFEVERYIENDDVKLHPSLVKELPVSEKKSKYPISIIPCRYNRCHFFSNNFGGVFYEMSKEIPNPILSNTFIPSFIDPNIIYTELYNYLLSIKDKKIIDNRTDIEKLESLGFDKKSSFRNPVYNANNKKNRNI